jgi:hypothetical protein
MITTKDYIEMVSYRRPEGSRSQRRFCNRYLKPVFGQPDSKGNYILRIGSKPKVAFMSHHDTVHAKNGRQPVTVDGNFAKATSDCLGADCTTGVYIMLRMIEARIEGLYIVHAAEEVGCLGSSHIVYQTPEVFDGIQAAISFDRKGYNSVITHQMGMRTCSDDFAYSLIDLLGLDYNLDTGGSFTDSNEYKENVPECTNISVGYFKQHTSQESQDLVFMDKVADACINADWSKLVIDRDPYMVETLWQTPSYFSDLDLEQIVAERPKSVALLLQSYGYTANELLRELGEIRDDLTWQ